MIGAVDGAVAGLGDDQVSENGTRWDVRSAAIRPPWVLRVACLLSAGDTQRSASREGRDT
jgi:hypothetical protein